MILYMFTDIHVIHQSNLRCDSGGGLDSFHHGHYFSFQFLLTQRLVSLLNRKVWCCLLSFLRLTLSLQSIAAYCCSCSSWWADDWAFWHSYSQKTPFFWAFVICHSLSLKERKKKIIVLKSAMKQETLLRPHPCRVTCTWGKRDKLLVRPAGSR